MKFFVLLLNFFSLLPGAHDSLNYKSDSGTVKFYSVAKMEVIKACSEKLKGVINTGTRSFAFVVPVSSFEGFNVALQKEHFNENYMESDKFPMASFTGKIIEDMDFSNQKSIVIRAKGVLKIHGVEQERIIKVTLEANRGFISVSSKFSVILKDHDIKVPKIVHEKIASEIIVELKAELIRED
jgi:hypothetical protein